jgi:ABC-type Na+ efflux pump permease subunit
VGLRGDVLGTSGVSLGLFRAASLIVVAAMFITAEYRRGRIHVLLTTVPRRGRLLAAKAVVIGAVGFAAGLVAAALAFAVGPGRLLWRQSRHPAGATPVALLQGPNSLFKRGVSRLFREPLAGTTVQALPGTLGHLRALFSQFKCMNRPLRAERIPYRIPPYKRGSLVRTQLRPPSSCS